MPRPRRCRLKELKTPEPEKPRTVPLYVCAGAVDEALPYALFPYGDGISRPRACPIRDCCLWFAGHDLGGRDAFSDFPEQAMLKPAFRRNPFSCPHFCDHEAKKRHRKHP
jgi:hypothetical protein